MRTLITGLALFFAISFLSISTTNAQEVGAGAPFFFPKNAGLSVPVSPFSIDGIGVKLSDYFGISTGFSWYRMSGMAASGLPFETEESMFDPFSAFIVPLDGSIILPFNKGDQKLILGGGYFWAFTGPVSMNIGELDRGLASTWDWPFVYTDIETKASTASGWSLKMEYIHFINKTVGIKVGGHYLFGEADLDIDGNASGLDETGMIVTRELDTDNWKMDFEGFEFRVGGVVRTKK